MENIEGLLSLFPVELLSLIFSYADLKSIKSIMEINNKCLCTAVRSVTSFSGKFRLASLAKLPRFPYLRRLFGLVRVDTLREFELLADLDLCHFTVVYTKHPNTRAEEEMQYQVICTMFAKLSNIETVTIVRRNKVSLMKRCKKIFRKTHHDDHFDSETLVSMNRGILGVETKDWGDAFCKYAATVPFDGIIMNTWHYNYVNLLMMPIVTVVLPFVPTIPSTLPYILRINDEACASIRCIVYSLQRYWFSESYKNFFDPSLFNRSYPLIEAISLPILRDQIPDLLRIFPNVKIVKICIIIGRVVPLMDHQKVKEKEEEERKELESLYPGITFKVLGVRNF